MLHVCISLVLITMQFFLSVFADVATYGKFICDLFVSILIKETRSLQLRARV